MTNPSSLSPRKKAIAHRSARWLKWILIAAVAAGAWHLYDNRTPECDSLARYGAKRVNDTYCVVPNALEISGAWDWRRLPDNLVVHGDLTIKGTYINALPDGIVVDGDIYLYKTDVSHLPVNAWVRGSIEQDAGMYSAIPIEQLEAWRAYRAKNPSRPADAP